MEKKVTISAKTRIINIGNSRGIRIPKLILEKADLDGEVELKVQTGRLIVSQARGARFDWDKQFEKMAQHGDDRMLDSETIATSGWDDNEWEW